MKVMTLYFIKNTEKNRLWYKDLVGRTLNEVQFGEILCPFWVDFERIERKVRSVTID